MSAEFPLWLEPYGPQLSLSLLVESINTIFHSFAAATYDRDHPEIHRQLPPLWSEMIEQLPDSPCWNVLDLGCGTGFEADLVLSRLADRVVRFTAYDPSGEMLAVCRRRLEGRFPQVAFCTQLKENRANPPFNLLLTNSLLHHLPKMEETIRSLLPTLAPGAYWLAGHEPSSRFFFNQDCVRLLADYRRFRSCARWLDWKSYRTRVSKIVRRTPLATTARLAFDQGLFLKRPTTDVIDRLVDFGVSRSADPSEAGIDPEQMRMQMQPDWELQWSKTYAFLGPFSAAGLSSRWAKRAQQLERKFPADGANFCTVWQRKPGC